MNEAIDKTRISPNIVFSGLLIIWAITFVVVFPNPLELFLSNWIIIPIAFIAAAFANATAVGGGFLFVPLFIFIYGLTPLTALKLSLATQAFGMTSGSFGWSKRNIITKAFLIAAVTSGIGMYVGTFEVSLASINIKKVFGVASIIIFFIVMLEIRYGRLSHNEEIVEDSFLKSFLFGICCFAGGFITAWTAIGIGEVVALYLLFVYRIRIEAAIGTGVAALAVDSILGLVFHTNIGGIPWEYLIFTVPGVLLGGFFGARLGRLLEEKIKMKRSEKSYTVLTEHSHSPLKWLFAIIILVDGIIMLI